MHRSLWCHLRSTGGFSQIREFRYLEMARGAGGSSRPSSPPDTLNTLSRTNSTWDAKSDGEELSLRSPVDPVSPPGARSSSPGRLAPLPEQPQPAGRQAGRATMCHTQFHTIHRARQYFWACFAIKRCPLWTNMAEQHWVASTSSFCSFQKFPSLCFWLSLPCAPFLTILSCLLWKALVINGHNSA